MGVSGPSLLIESTDSMMNNALQHCSIYLLCRVHLLCPPGLDIDYHILGNPQGVKLFVVFATIYES